MLIETRVNVNPRSVYLFARVIARFMRARYVSVCVCVCVLVKEDATSAKHGTKAHSLPIVLKKLDKCNIHVYLSSGSTQTVTLYLQKMLNKNYMQELRTQKKK